MPQPLSMDLRQRILAAYDAGEKTAAVAQRFAVSPACARRLKQRRRECGEVAPRKGRPGPKPVLAGQSDRLRQAAQDQPDLSAAEYRDRLGLGCSALTVWRALRGLGLTFKKK
jgi:transposase